MRKLLLAGGVVVALGLPGAALAFGPSDNPQAVHACADTARRQFEGGVTPINRGHGVIGHPATNCDPLLAGHRRHRQRRSGRERTSLRDLPVVALPAGSTLSP
jgi:hypothetical protein